MDFLSIDCSPVEDISMPRYGYEYSQIVKGGQIFLNKYFVLSNFWLKFIAGDVTDNKSSLVR